MIVDLALCCWHCRLLHRCKHPLRLLLELLILWFPVWIVGCFEHVFQLGAGRLGRASFQQQLREKEMRGCAVGVVREGRAKMPLGFFVAAAKQSWDSEIPSPQCAIGGTLLEGRIESKHRFERFLDRPAVFEASSKAE
jgi:hypothetical protein